MKWYLLVTADEFEIPLVCKRNSTQLLEYLYKYKGRRKTLFEMICRYANTNSKKHSTLGKCFIRTVNVTPDLDDIYFTLNQNKNYIFDNFSDQDIYKLIGISPRTFYRHKSDKRWLLTRIAKVYYTQISQPTETF